MGDIKKDPDFDDEGKQPEPESIDIEKLNEDGEVKIASDESLNKITDNEDNLVSKQNSVDSCVDGSNLQPLSSSSTPNHTPLSHKLTTTTFSNEYISAELHATYFNNLNYWMSNMKLQFQHMSISLGRQFQQPLDVNNLQSENLMVECKSAPIWKRILAEFIDGFIIFQIKFYIVLLLQNFLDYNLKDYADFLENPAIFHTITSGIALMDLVSRFVNFVYEAYFIWKEGATPGKRIAGIKVYWVEVVVPNAETGMVRVYPCNQVQLPKALLRSLLKSIGLFIFLYGFFISNFTRAGHDLVAKTLVVDESEPMRNRPNVDGNRN